jgi:hypothetical protein
MNYILPKIVSFSIIFIILKYGFSIESGFGLFVIEFRGDRKRAERKNGYIDKIFP